MSKKIFLLVLHAVLWLVLIGAPFLLFYEDDPKIAFEMLLSPNYWLFTLSFGALFYTNFYFLIPKLYCKEKYGQYTFSIVILFVFFYLLKPFFLLFKVYLIRSGLEHQQGYSLRSVDGVSIILFIIVVSVGMAIQMVKQWRATEKRALKAESEKNKAELSFLKAQVNPHFLYNTLNNIYALSVTQHPETSESILKLSSIMRYITEEVNDDLVSLEKEIDCLRNYIELQELRLNTNISVSFEVTGDPANKLIAPLIFITYIENAFKYGISSHENAAITIRLEVKEKKVVLFCQNKIFPSRQDSGSTGIGIANNRQRLKYLYPNKYQPVISKENGLCTIKQALPFQVETPAYPNFARAEDLIKRSLNTDFNF